MENGKNEVQVTNNLDGRTGSVPTFETVVRNVQIPQVYSPTIQHADPILEEGSRQTAALCRIASACENLVEYARLMDRQADVYQEKVEEQLWWTKVLSFAVLCTPIIAVGLMALLG